MNEYLKAWDTYLLDSNGEFTDEERIAFKNGWVYAVDYFLSKGRSLWNAAVFPERSQSDEDYWGGR